MRRVRHGEPFASGMTATGFWLGITCGRVVLGFVTPKLGEKLSIVVSILKEISMRMTHSAYNFGARYTPSSP